MRVAVVSANLGGFDTPPAHVVQTGVEVDHHLFTDATLPPRPRAMTPRLQAKIPKMFAWDMRPGYDAYLWVDASLQLSQPTSVEWFLAQLAGHDIAVFTHPHRATVREEAEFLRMKLATGSRYLRTRYAGEDLDGQVAALADLDLPLYAAGAFIYRPTPPVCQAMRTWWYHTTRFHCIDQLAFPQALQDAGCAVRVINEDIYHASHVAFVRASGHG